jgi:hypothetical protein
LSDEEDGVESNVALVLEKALIALAGAFLATWHWDINGKCANNALTANVTMVLSVERGRKEDRKNSSRLTTNTGVICGKSRPP